MLERKSEDEVTKQIRKSFIDSIPPLIIAFLLFFVTNVLVNNLKFNETIAFIIGIIIAISIWIVVILSTSFLIHRK